MQIDLTKLAVTDTEQEIGFYKYGCRDADGNADTCPEDVRIRVANAIMEHESAEVREAAVELLTSKRYLPAGRIQANAGTGRSGVTLSNCYMMGEIDDSIDGIFRVLGEAAKTQQTGGGVGYNFSSIRPKGAIIAKKGTTASGPLSFMQVFDATCGTIRSAAERRGAQMAVLNCDHPDIEEYIEAKRQQGNLTMFNMSIGVSDAFMDAVRKDRNWDLVFKGKVYKTVKATELWDKMVEANYDWAEPGILFLDRINKLNNLNYCETIVGTNPCGEQPLGPYGACLLGSVNLYEYVEDKFSSYAKFNFEQLSQDLSLIVRFNDNVASLSDHALEEQRDAMRRTRRMGVGITGLASAFIALGVKYGDESSRQYLTKIMDTINYGLYSASVDLAEERGAFPDCDPEKYIQSGFLQKQLSVSRYDWKSLLDRIAKFGIRNSHLTSIAPTGTISMFAGNVSSGIEPIFDYGFVRDVRQEDNTTKPYITIDKSVSDYIRSTGEVLDTDNLPAHFITAKRLAPKEHIEMVALAQTYIDSAVSKTINLPEDMALADTKDLYMYAYELGLKGCTIYRSGCKREGILTSLSASTDEPAPTEVKEETVTPRTTVTRPVALRGATYCIEAPNDVHYYVTINDAERADGTFVPYEIFINTPVLNKIELTNTIAILSSALLKELGDWTTVCRKLKSIADPTGGFMMRGIGHASSLPAAVAKVIAEHANNTTHEATPTEIPLESEKLLLCENCNEYGVEMKEGCLMCKLCFFSKCG